MWCGSVRRRSRRPRAWRTGVYETVPVSDSKSQRSDGTSASSSERGRRFEVEVRETLYLFGWEASLTPGSGDLGCDILAKCGTTILVVQCKDWAQGVGYEAVKEVHTARSLHRATQAAVIIRGRFVRGVHQKAAELDIHLLHIDELRAGHKLDRSAEGQRIRSKRAADAAAKERAEAAARQREVEAAQREAAARRRESEAQRRQAHMQQREHDEAVRREDIEKQNREWSRYDLAIAEFEGRHGQKVLILLGLLLAALALVLGVPILFRTHAGWAILLACGGVVALARIVVSVVLVRRPSAPIVPRPVPPLPDRRVVLCVHCGIGMRLPAQKSGNVTCPECKRTAWYGT